MIMAAPVIMEPIAVAPQRNDEALYEVVDGQRVELPPMSAYASWIAGRLDHRLGPFAETHALGSVVPDTLFILDAERDLRRRPDVAYVSVERWPLGREIPYGGDWEVVPDLAVEVISPHDLFQAVIAKIREYFQVGVRQVWVIVPTEKQVYVYTSPTEVRILSSSDELDGGALLPGFRLSVATLFKTEMSATTPPQSPGSNGG
jgi:Uma2 family endonuclease